MTKISEVIDQLKAIENEHGDIPIYAFDEYSEGGRSINICFIETPSRFDDWQFPHVQIGP